MNIKDAFAGIMRCRLFVRRPGIVRDSSRTISYVLIVKFSKDAPCGAWDERSPLSLNESPNNTMLVNEEIPPRRCGARIAPRAAPNRANIVIHRPVHTISTLLSDSLGAN